MHMSICSITHYYFCDHPNIAPFVGLTFLDEEFLPTCVLNGVQFPWDSYAPELASLEAMTREEVVSMLKRNSTGFSRGRSRYRGVTSAFIYIPLKPDIWLLLGTTDTSKSDGYTGHLLLFTDQVLCYICLSSSIPH